MAAVRINVGGIRHQHIGPASAASGWSIARLASQGDPPVDMDAVGCGPVERIQLTPEEAAARGFTIGERVVRHPLRPVGTGLTVTWSPESGRRGAEKSAERARNQLPMHSEEKIRAVLAEARNHTEAARRLGTSPSSLSRWLRKMRQP